MPSSSSRHVKALASGTLVYGLGEVLNRSVSFLILPLLTAYLTPADLGISGMLTALGFLLVPVFSVGLGSAIAPAYFDSETPEHQEALMGTAIAILAVSAAVMTAIVAVTAPWISEVSFQTPDYAGFVLLTTAGTVFTILTIPLRQYLQFERRQGLYVLLSTLSTLATVALTLALVVAVRRGIAGLVEATVAGQVITFALFALPAARRLRMRLSSAHARQLLSVGVPMVPAFGAVFLLQHGAKYLLQEFRGIDAVGIYTIGLNIGLVVSVLVTAFQSAWVPFFMSFASRPDEARAHLSRITTYYVFSFGAVALAVFVVARFVVLLMTQPPFHPAWQVVGLSATTQFLSGLFIVLLPGMYYAKEVRWQLLPQAAAAIGSLLLCIALIPPFGTFGAALAMMLGYIALVAMLLALNRARRYLPVRYEWLRLARFAIAYVIVAAVTLLNRELTLFAEAVAASVGLVVVGGLVWTQLSAAERADVVAFVRRVLTRRNATLLEPEREA